MVEWGWIILYRCALMGRFYEFTCRAAKPTVSGGDILLFTFSPAAFGNRRSPTAPSFAVRFLPTSLLNQRPPVAQSFCFAFLPAALLNRRSPVAISCLLRFYRHSLFGTTSGGPIFLCLKKDRGERQTKGAAAPVGSPE